MIIKRITPLFSLTFFAFIVFGLILFILPTFLYNELELKFRHEYTLAFSELVNAEKSVQLRKAGSTEYQESFIDLGKAIELNISNARVNISNAQSYNHKQKYLLFLLNDKYRQYHHKKVAAIDELQKLEEKHLIRKQNEHLATNTLLLVFDSQQKIRSVRDPDQWWETIDELPERNKTITTNANQLLQSGYISKEVYNYYLKQVELFQLMFNESQKVAQAESWEAFDKQALEQLAAEDINLDELFKDGRDTSQIATDLFYQQIDNNFENLYDASNFYNQNGLANDKLSIMLSYLTKAYPRMKKANQQQPIFVPVETNPYLLSFKL